MKAVYEVVLGKGAGAERKAERFLPQGSDMTARVKTVQECLAHSLEFLGDVTSNINIEEL